MQWGLVSPDQKTGVMSNVDQAHHQHREGRALATQPPAAGSIGQVQNGLLILSGIPATLRVGERASFLAGN